MSEINTGGPAFPVVAENGLGHVADGMTLRDWFAGKSIAAVWHDIPEDANRQKALTTLGRLSYEMADAMIAARGAA